MLYHRTGFPEEDEIVLCKVTQIFPNSVFVDLVEYGRQGMIHISEIAPGRIKNLREYVTLGREVICKVLRISQERGYIDLSLRRVNSTQREAKLEEMKQEQKAESLVKNLSKKMQLPVEELYRKLTASVFPQYSYLHSAFADIVEGTLSLEKLGLEQNVAREVTAAVLEKFKPEKIIVQGEISLQTYAPDGVGKVKEILHKVQQVSSSMTLRYLGGGRYRLRLEDVDYKPAEKKLALVEEVLKGFDDKISVAAFKRISE